MTTGGWNYLPILLISLASLIWIWEKMFRLGYASSTTQLTIESLVDKAAVPELMLNPVEKEYAPDTLGKHLLGIYRRRHMEAEVTALLRPHIGKWVRMTGYISNLTGDDTKLRASLRPSPKDVGSLFTVYFDRQAEPLLIALKHGSKVSFAAQIVDSYGHINLKHAEIA